MPICWITKSIASPRSSRAGLHSAFLCQRGRSAHGRFFNPCSDRQLQKPLQEWALATLGENPHYAIVRESGPDHAKQRVAVVQIGGQPYGEGIGRSKQDAEKEAARDALGKLGLL